MSASRRIALFGGTFDPVHLGHIRIAEAARNALSLDEVRFIPCRVSPHKLAGPPTNAADRVEMLRIATRDMPWAVVDDCETRHEGPSYSWKTADEMAARFPAARLFWIMGNDQWKALSTWARPDRLASTVEFIVCTRDTAPESREGYVMHAVQMHHPASATAIRQAIAVGQTKHPWLDPVVAEWIEKHGLYHA